MYAIVFEPFDASPDIPHVRVSPFRLFGLVIAADIVLDAFPSFPNAALYPVATLYWSLETDTAQRTY